MKSTFQSLRHSSVNIFIITIIIMHSNKGVESVMQFVVNQGGFGFMNIPGKSDDMVAHSL